MAERGLKCFTTTLGRSNRSSAVSIEKKTLISKRQCDFVLGLSVMTDCIDILTEWLLNAWTLEQYGIMPCRESELKRLYEFDFWITIFRSN